MTNETTFTKVSDIEIPDIFFRRLKTEVEEIVTIFGEGILPGSTITLCGVPGTGKCHHPDEEIEIFGDDDIIDQMRLYISNVAG